jgi:hypothetical protein
MRVVWEGTLPVSQNQQQRAPECRHWTLRLLLQITEQKNMLDVTRVVKVIAILQFRLEK